MTTTPSLVYSINLGAAGRSGLDSPPSGSCLISVVLVRSTSKPRHVVSSFSSFIGTAGLAVSSSRATFHSGACCPSPKVSVYRTAISAEGGVERKTRCLSSSPHPLICAVCRKSPRRSIIPQGPMISWNCTNVNLEGSDLGCRWMR
jgi:hypothetical protein